MMKNSKFVLAAMLLLISGILVAPAIMAHNIDVYNTKSLENTYKSLKANDDSLRMYKVTKSCDKVSTSKVDNFWKSKNIVSKQTYYDVRHPHKAYCGIVYKYKVK